MKREIEAIIIFKEKKISIPVFHEYFLTRFRNYLVVFGYFPFHRLVPAPFESMQRDIRRKPSLFSTTRVDLSR